MVYGCLFLLAAAASAQEPSTRRLGLLGVQIDRMEAELRGKTAALRRDAFIVSQVVAAAGELDDFQRNTALQKARNHIQDALKRAADNPPAGRPTVENLESQRDLIEHAKQQGATADISALKRELMKRSHFLQRTLFRELDDARRDRQLLSDLQTRLSRMTSDLDEALSEALGSTFDYFRVGGQ
jgi:hypothetical protein